MHTPRIRCALYRILISRFAAGFGTLLLQVAGFHRAVPSTTLDKASMQFVYILLKFRNLSTLFIEKIHNSFVDISAKNWYHKNTLLRR